MRQQDAADDVFRGLGGTAGVTRAVQKPKNLGFDFVVNSVIPPARDIAKRVLSLAEEKAKEFSENGLVADLQKSWSKMHFLRTVEDSGAIAPLRDPKQSLAKRTQ